MKSSNAWSPVGGTVWEELGRRGLIGGGVSLRGVGFEVSKALAFPLN